MIPTRLFSTATRGRSALAAAPVPAALPTNEQPQREDEQVTSTQALVRGRAAKESNAQEVRGAETVLCPSRDNARGLGYNGATLRRSVPRARADSTRDRRLFRLSAHGPSAGRPTHTVGGGWDA